MTNSIFVHVGGVVGLVGCALIIVGTIGVRLAIAWSKWREKRTERGRG